ncbi:MAG: amino acid adenylation domain-containing protein, partial [bacterium]|nr:amino acid adenylation domain-containing protein [bacterium]
VLLQIYSNCDDVVFGTTAAGRSAKIKGIEDMAGLFINTIPCRVTLRPGEKVKELLTRLNTAIQEKTAYESTRLVNIIEYSEIDKNEELFDTILAIENYPLDSRLTHGDGTAALSPGSYSMVESTHYDLAVNITLFGDMAVTFIYKRRAFDKEIIESLAGHFVLLLNRMMENPDKPTVEIEILPEEEKQRLLVEFNRTDAGFPKDKTIHRLFEEQAGRMNDRIALADISAAGRRHLSYKDLNEKSGRLAALLMEKGVQPGAVVGIMVERSIEMAVGILGILKAGGAYMPIAPEYPEERKSFMLADSNTGILVTTAELCETLIGCREQACLFLDRVFSSPGGSRPSRPASCSVGPTNVAYIIYTSGTTGRPKGVLIRHENVVRLMFNDTFLFNFSSSDTWTLFHSYCFDFSVWEMYGALLYGGRLIVLPRSVSRDPEKFSDVLEKENVTVLNQTPSAFYTLAAGILSGPGRNLKLKYIIFGGEALTPSRLWEWNQAYPGTKLINMFGITETTVHVTFKEIGPAELGSRKSSIGKPIPTLSVYVMDKYFRLLPIGVPGECFVGGAGVAGGYLNRPELTWEKFIDNPHKRGERLYRSGDLVRFSAAGELEYLGRIDRQVKIRGFRIELGEIESRLLKHELIKETVVIQEQGREGDNSLCAYIVSDGELGISRLKTFLAERLPGYMVPAHFVNLEELPLTPNGKIDRKKLPAPEGMRPQLESAFTAPGNEIEKTIANAWQEVLTLDKVGIDDNFFDLGGNSLSIIRVNTQLKETLKRDIAIVDLFTYPTIRTLSRYLSGAAAEPGVNVDVTAGRQITPAGETGAGIAVIGMAGRFPGAENIEQFWWNLKNGVESITFFSPRELAEVGIEPQLLQSPNYIGAKGVIEAIEYFDAPFFDYTTPEAELMDPQVRLFHEYSWAALENAGYSPEKYTGSVGLYAGFTNNFHWLTWKYRSGLRASEQFELGNLNSNYFSTLVSYKLNLKGPSVTVNTACSTSLTAVDTACRALSDGQCNLALAGGVCITYPVKSGYLYQEGMVNSPDGHCRAFDKEAKGTVHSNGIGIVVLKPLEAAIADGDTIHAVIKGSASNNDGKRKVGYTAPSVDGQAEVITAAMRKAGIGPETIGYIETHGTGTALGDPIEIQGLKKAFTVENRSLPGGSIAIGSAKTNIGHLDAAAGVTGVIKATLALKNKLIPPSLFFNTPNPALQIEAGPFYVNTVPKEWKSAGSPLRAGVSSFGIGGTNAHVVLEEWPEDDVGAGSPRPQRPQLLTLSAKTETAFDRMTRNLAEHLTKNKDIDLANAAYTLQTGRNAFEYRKTLTCRDVNGAVEALSSPGLRTSRAKEADRPVVFMFSGQGAQYVNMGLGLYRAEPVFREEMDRCFEILNPILGYDIKELLYPEGEERSPRR